MVKGGRGPAAGGMAGTTICTELTAMRIIRRVAGIAGSGCVIEDIVGMTARAGHVDVLACQFEGGRIMVKGGWLPPRGGVTGTA